jgi:hypothetical protein
MRFRILELLIVTGVFAFAMASLKRADLLFETLFFSFTLLVILVAVLLAISRRGGARVFWIAFATTSSLCLVLAHVPDADGLSPRENGPEFTTRLLRLAYKWSHPDAYLDNSSPKSGGGFFSVQDVPSDSRGPDDPAPAQADFDSLIEIISDTVGESDEPLSPFPTNLTLVIGSGQRVVTMGDPVSFMRIGHSAWALLLGWIAGHFTRCVYQRASQT